MKRYALYILGIGFGIGMLNSCSKEEVPYSLSGDGQKNPVTVVGTVDGVPMTSAVTRAADNIFAVSDEIKAYFQHVKKPSSSIEVVNPTNFSQLKTLAVSNAGSSPSYEASLTCSAGMYWEDFSNNTGTDEDIRAANHGLRALYAYCYNGGTPTTALTAATGVLGWTTPADQTGGIKNYDLLWAPTSPAESATPPYVVYAHGASKNADHGKVTLPFKHAMSKVTVILEVGDGFPANYAYTSDKIVLNNGTNKFHTVCTATAPTTTISDQGTDKEITMKKGTPETVSSKRQCTFEAIVIPGSALAAADATFATIMADGNKYIVPVTADMRSTDAGKWGTQLDGDNLKSGVNYVLKVHVDKVKVTVDAYITNWTTVNAGPVDGEIVFDPDIVSYSGAEGTAIAAADANFNLYDINTTLVNTTDNASYTNVTTPTLGASGWENSPKIYWPNGNDSFYFRGLGKADGSHEIEASTTTSLTQGMTEDVLWGTTSDHTGDKASGGTMHFNAGVAISPRTGLVPMTFYHAMSKLTIKLVTEGEPESDVTPIVLPAETKWVDLDGATIAISDLYKSATLSLHNGTADSKGGKPADHAAAISGTCTSVDAGKLNGTTNIVDLLVIPQTITDDAVISIQLADGTKYKLQLNQIEKTGTTTKIGEWKKGENYIYTIKLTKELMQSSAQIKDWVDTSGSGVANLDWD